MLAELKNIKSGNKELREFGLTIGAILVMLGAVGLWRGRAAYPYYLAPGIALMALGFIRPPILKPAHKLWMGLSVVLGFFVSRLILTALFYAVITPIGLVARALGNDILDQRICREKASYWKKRDEAGEKTKESYENQY